MGETRLTNCIMIRKLETVGHIKDNIGVERTVMQVTAARSMDWGGQCGGGNNIKDILDLKEHGSLLSRPRREQRSVRNLL